MGAIDAFEITAGITFGALREDILRAVTDCLPEHGNQEWRTEKPAALADLIAARLLAGVAPVISNLMVNGGIDVARQVMADGEWLARNGLQRIEAADVNWPVQGDDEHIDDHNVRMEAAMFGEQDADLEA